MKRDEGRVRRAVFFAKTQLLVAIEITAPFSFEREAGGIIEDYAATIRTKLDVPGDAAQPQKRPGRPPS